MTKHTPTGFADFVVRNRYSLLIAGILAVYGIYLQVDIMEIDAAQYASIAREMQETGQYLQVHFRGQDYLDKPPLLFWLTSIPVGWLGPTALAYKLFPFLILILGLYATYRFTAVWYGRTTGILAMLMTASTQAFFLMANDVRTDGLLTSWIMLSVWQLSCYLKKGKMIFLLTSGLCIGMAMLSKGPIGIVIPAAAVGGHLLLSRQWSKILDVRWLLVLLVVAVVLAPMCYGLYQQFDLHPEKEVYGLHGPSGLGFFFWTQSFGRITGDNPFNNHAPWHYLIGTMMWDFQPWVWMWIPAFWFKVQLLWRRRVDAVEPTEWISLCGFVLPFIALSFSAYKLPHYIFPLFPFAAVMLAAFMVQHASRWPGWMDKIQLVIVHVFMLAPLAVIFWAFPVHTPWLPLLWGIGYAIFWWFRSLMMEASDRLILPTVVAVLLFQIMLALHFYPHLLRYQSESQVGRYIKEAQPERIYWHEQYGYALDYYSDRVIPNAYGPPVDSLPPGTWIWVSGEALPTMPPNRVLRVYDDFQVSKLSVTFLNPSTRPQKLRKMYLIELAAH